ncbi:hypothetical protein Btru_031851 [Bulinus truncatus]|nr:hypothetical protein Btru_031851 [Bulinus truncatus]
MVQLQGVFVLLMTSHVILVACDDSLSSKFKRFEILRPSMVQVRVKRDSGTGGVKTKTLTLFALDRLFVLNLLPGAPGLHSQFRVVLVDGRGDRTPYALDRSVFYSGQLQGDDSSGADIVQIEDAWVGRIFTHDTAYGIEPLDYHEGGNGRTQLMVMYDYRDVRSNQTGSAFCQEIYFDESGRLHLKNRAHLFLDHGQTFRKRQQRHDAPPRRQDRLYEKVGRSSGVPDSCELLAVADYRALVGIGQGSVQKLAGILVNTYQSADRIFNGTKFGDLGPQRLMLSSILIHTEYTHVEPDALHYNMEAEMGNATAVIMTLTDVPYFRQFCLMHLTTQRNFGETLGLAATAENDSDIWFNGICADSDETSRNIGLSTPLTMSGQPMPLSKYVYVVSHELGHNWGSSHDPATSGQCSPSSQDGGKFLMWARSGAGVESNANKFSPCSIADITGVLKSKAHRCFRPQDSLRHGCGDGILDVAEQCDVGFNEDDKDQCCQRNCRLKKRAVCSPYNHPCCTPDCQVAPKTQLCQDASLSQCYRTPHCTGADHRTCPYPEASPNNASCEDRGTCWYGRCLTFCEARGMWSDPPRDLSPCNCDNDTEVMCQYCCRDVLSPRECVSTGTKMDDGAPCLIGFCKMGVCIKSTNLDSLNSQDDPEKSMSKNNAPVLKIVHFLILAIVSHFRPI